MRLDQFGTIRKPGSQDKIEIAYWRKHPNLQGWMEALWRSKGGTGEFNCEEVELTFQDLDNLMDAIKGSNLPQTQGFFFGSDKDYYYSRNDLNFVRDAKAAIADGYQVFYLSWW
jgi:hypothetical protein